MPCNPYVDAGVRLTDESFDGVDQYKSILSYRSSKAAQFDQKQLRQAVQAANVLFPLVSADKYPNIRARFVSGVPLGMEEFAEFIAWSNRSAAGTIDFANIILENDFGYTYEDGQYVPLEPIGESVGVVSANGIYSRYQVSTGAGVQVADTATGQRAHNLLDDFEIYLKGEIATGLVGMICALYQNPFKIAEIIEDIKNFKLPSMKEIVDKIKDKVKEIIDNVIEGIQRRFENIKQAIVELAEKSQQAFKQIRERVEAVGHMFEEASKRTLKENVELAMKKIFHQFAEITQNVLDFIMYRICKLTSQIESDLSFPVTNLEVIKDNFKNARQVLTNQSSLRTSDFVRAGGVRMDYTKREEIRGSIRSDINSLSTASSGNGGALRDLIDRTEGGGNYNTLYNNAQNGAFAGTNVSDMTIEEVLNFTNPSGSYGSYVASINGGTVATPTGRFQIVGSTLAGAADALNLSSSTVYDAATQNRIADYLIASRLARADSIEGKMAQLRTEWVGLRRVSDAELAAAISQFESGGGSSSGTQDTTMPTTYLAQPISEEEMNWIANLTEAGDSNIRFAPQVISMSEKARSHWQGNKGSYWVEGQNYTGAGWKEIALRNPAVYIMLRRVAMRLGKTLTFNSCYRSQYYNIHCVNTTTGPDSPHSKAMAVDVTMNNLTKHEAALFVKYCSQEGFRRVSAYEANFIHVDIMNHGRGNWTKYYLGNAEVEEAVKIHLADGYRKG